ncbi:DUF3788 domain-containing protein [Sphingobium nicotianae]|uniref:DUF3788 family protein n=1 Tax=Sphingobium nicotianae TaxID=2782607 RepID=A0A9X1DER6_9SPHN|nr:DUF3788 domain-containing protein [Sphingobium nicotianae]MBT2188208.1 DUF3788 family protein [Sphingobium nicotianae]
MDHSPQVGDRLTDKSAPPDDAMIRDWLGPAAFEHWAALRDWIDASYPGVFAADWIYGGKKHGWSLRYKKSRAFCTFLPEYRAFSAVVVLGAAEREKVEARRDELSSRLMALYDQTETYHDGKWLKMRISSAEERRDVTELLALKRPRRAIA